MLIELVQPIQERTKRSNVKILSRARPSERLLLIHANTPGFLAPGGLVVAGEGYSLVVVYKLLTAVASLVAEPRL